VSQKRCGMLPARSSNVSRRGVIHHALARATRGECGGGEAPSTRVWEEPPSPLSSAIARGCSGTLPGFGVSPSLPILPPRLGARGLMYCH
jgi:hypothetical protein